MLMADNFKELRERMIKAAKGDIKEAYGNEEYILIQAINAFNESSQELQPDVREAQRVVRDLLPRGAGWEARQCWRSCAIAMCSGEELDKAAIERIIDDPEKAESIYNKAMETMGRKPEGDEKEAVAAFANLSKDMGKGIQGLDAYIKSAAGQDNAQRHLPD